MPQFVTTDRDDNTPLTAILSASKAETEAELAVLGQKLAENGSDSALLEQSERLRTRLEKLAKYESEHASGGA